MRSGTRALFSGVATIAVLGSAAVVAGEKIGFMEVQAPKDEGDWRNPFVFKTDEFNEQQRLEEEQRLANLPLTTDSQTRLMAKTIRERFPSGVYCPLPGDADSQYFMRKAGEHLPGLPDYVDTSRQAEEPLCLDTAHADALQRNGEVWLKIGAIYQQPEGELPVSLSYSFETATPQVCEAFQTTMGHLADTFIQELDPAHLDTVRYPLAVVVDSQRYTEQCDPAIFEP